MTPWLGSPGGAAGNDRGTDSDNRGFDGPGSPRKVETIGHEALPRPRRRDDARRLLAVYLAVDEDPFGQAQGGGVGEELVVVGVAGQAAVTELVLGVPDIHGPSAAVVVAITADGSVSSRQSQETPAGEERHRVVR